MGKWKKMGAPQLKATSIHMAACLPSHSGPCSGLSHSQLTVSCLILCSGQFSISPLLSPILCDSICWASAWEYWGKPGICVDEFCSLNLILVGKCQDFWLCLRWSEGILALLSHAAALSFVPSKMCSLWKWNLVRDGQMDPSKLFSCPAQTPAHVHMIYSIPELQAWSHSCLLHVSILLSLLYPSAQRASLATTEPLQAICQDYSADISQNLLRSTSSSTWGLSLQLKFLSDAILETRTLLWPEGLLSLFSSHGALLLLLLQKCIGQAHPHQ